MEPNSSQAPHPGLSPDDAGANLSLATHLSTQLAAPQQPQEAPQGAPEDVTQIDLAPQVESMQKEIEALKKQVAQQPQDDIAEMKKMIEDALNEDEPEKT